MVARAQPDHAIGADSEELAPISAALIDPHALLTHALTEELSRTGIPTTAVWTDSAEELIVDLDRTEPRSCFSSSSCRIHPDHRSDSSDRCSGPVPAW